MSSDSKLRHLWHLFGQFYPHPKLQTSLKRILDSVVRSQTPKTPKSLIVMIKLMLSGSTFENQFVIAAIPRLTFCIDLQSSPASLLPLTHGLLFQPNRYSVSYFYLSCFILSCSSIYNSRFSCCCCDERRQIGTRIFWTNCRRSTLEQFSRISDLHSRSAFIKATIPIFYHRSVEWVRQVSLDNWVLYSTSNHHGLFVLSN